MDEYHATARRISEFHVEADEKKRIEGGEELSIDLSVVISFR